MIIAIVAFMFVGLTHAQTKFAIKAGANFSTFTGKSYADVSMKTGFHAGGFAEIKASEKLFIQLELLYSEQGAKIDMAHELSDDVIYVDYDEKWNVNYLTVPVMVKYYVYRGLHMEAGPQIGILLSAKEKYDTNFTSPDFPGESIKRSGSEDISELFKSINVALNAGVGYDFKSHIFANVRYSYGLSDIYDDQADRDQVGTGVNNKIVSRNNVLSLSVGYKF